MQTNSNFINEKNENDILIIDIVDAIVSILSNNNNNIVTAKCKQEILGNSILGASYQLVCRW